MVCLAQRAGSRSALRNHFDETLPHRYCYIDFLRFWSVATIDTQGESLGDAHAWEYTRTMKEALT